MGEFYDLIPVDLQIDLDPVEPVDLHRDINKLKIWERGLLLPLKPSFLLGHVSSQLTTNSALEVRENVSVHLLSILSPSMLITCYLSFILHSYINLKEKFSLKDYDLDTIFCILGIIFAQFLQEHNLLLLLRLAYTCLLTRL